MLLARFVSGQLYAILPVYLIVAIFSHTISIIPNTTPEFILWAGLTVLGLPVIIRGERLSKA